MHRSVPQSGVRGARKVMRQGALTDGLMVALMLALRVALIAVPMVVLAAAPTAVVVMTVAASA